MAVWVGFETALGVPERVVEASGGVGTLEKRVSRIIAGVDTVWRCESESGGLGEWSAVGGDLP